MGWDAAFTASTWWGCRKLKNTRTSPSATSVTYTLPGMGRGMGVGVGAGGVKCACRTPQERTPLHESGQRPAASRQ